MLLRHGRTADNASGRFQGQLDTPLDAFGRRQAAAVADVLAQAQPELLLSSDLARATATAAPLAARTGRTVRTDARLRELHLGAWQGLTGEEAGQRFPDEHEAWRLGRDVARGGGETYADAGARATACLLEALPELAPGGVLVAVTHGGTARGVLGTLLEADPAQWWRYAPLGNACWSVLVEHPRGWRLERHGAGTAALDEPASWASPGEVVAARSL